MLSDFSKLSKINPCAKALKVVFSVDSFCHDHILTVKGKN